MDLHKFKPGAITASAEEIANLNKETIEVIMEEFKHDHSVTPYLRANYKGGGNIPKTTNFTYRSLLAIMKTGYEVSNIRLSGTDSPEEIAEPIIVKNEMYNEPIELAPIIVENEKVEVAEEKCCENPEDCKKEACPDGKLLGPLPIDTLEKEDIFPLLDDRGVDYKKNFGVKRLRSLLKETENK